MIDKQDFPFPEPVTQAMGLSHVLSTLFAPSGAVHFSKPSLRPVLLYPTICTLVSFRMGEKYTFLWKAGVGRVVIWVRAGRKGKARYRKLLL